MVNKTSLVLLSFSSSIWWITVDTLVISVAEKYFRVGLKYLVLLKKKFTVQKFTINYCTNLYT